MTIYVIKALDEIEFESIFKELRERGLVEILAVNPSLIGLNGSKFEVFEVEDAEDLNIESEEEESEDDIESEEEESEDD